MRVKENPLIKLTLTNIKNFHLFDITIYFPLALRGGRKAVPSFNRPIKSALTLITSRRPCHKGISPSYTQGRQTPGQNDSDPTVFREALSLGCDSRQHQSRVLRRCRSSRTRRGDGNGWNQEMSEVLWAVHGIPVPSNRRGLWAQWMTWHTSSSKFSVAK